MPKLSISEAAYLLGVSTDTLRRWEKEGKITSTRTEGGHRRYDLTDILKDKEDDGLTILYARVSTRPQIKDLDRLSSGTRNLCRNQGLEKLQNY